MNKLGKKIYDEYMAILTPLVEKAKELLNNPCAGSIKKASRLLKSAEEIIFIGENEERYGIWGYPSRDDDN